MIPIWLTYHESGAVVYMMENCSLRLYDSGLAVYKSTIDTGDSSN